MAGTVQVLAGHRLLSAPAGHRTSHDVGVADLLAAVAALLVPVVRGTEWAAHSTAAREPRCSGH
jgi:hypothetical protein